MKAIFTYDEKADADVAAWLAEQPARERSAAIRAAIRMTLAATDAPVTQAELRRILREELAQVTLARENAAPARQDVDLAAAALLDEMF